MLFTDMSNPAMEVETTSETDLHCQLIPLRDKICPLLLNILQKSGQ